MTFWKRKVHLFIRYEACKSYIHYPLFRLFLLLWESDYVKICKVCSVYKYTYHVHVCVYIILIVDINAETFAEAYSTVRSSCSTSCNPEKKNQKKIVPDVFTVYISLFMDYACKSSSSATQIFARSHSFATELLQLSENQEPDTPRGRGGSIDDIGGLYHHCVCLRRNKTHTMTERFHNTMHKPRPPRWVPNSPSGWVTSHVNYYQPVAILLCRLSSSSKLQTV